MENLAFIPGTLPEHPGPLGRFLPPIPMGVVTSWLDDHASPGAWVLEPFGAAPRLAVEAARAGYRVLVASNNPIDRFLIDLVANPPGEAELRSSLADLGALTKGDQRIEPLLRNLYATRCEHCQQEVNPETFIWERGAVLPKFQIYHCSHCGEGGEFSLLEDEARKLTQIPSSQLHRSRALERVTALDDPDRPLVEEALDVYLPRALYALFTLINKIESLPPQRRRVIQALLLATFDQASALWPHPTQRARPRQLAVPAQFKENNVWLAMEGAIEAWTKAYPVASAHLPWVIWPAQPPQSGGICLFEGRFRDLAEHLAGSTAAETKNSAIQVQAAFAALPRPNQAYWTLSTLWSGWLWGRETAAPIKSVLRRRRYDWNWHTAALHAAFVNLRTILQPGTAFAGLIGEAEPGFLSAALLAASQAEFELSGLALNQPENQAQIEWRKPDKDLHPFLVEPSTVLTEQISNFINQACRDYLKRRGEPASYLDLHCAGLSKLISLGFPNGTRFAVTTPGEESSPAELLTQVQNSFQQALTYSAGFVRYHGSTKSLEIGQWWLRESNLHAEANEPSRQVTPTEEIDIPLADRIEMEAVRLLIDRPGLKSRQIDEWLANEFRGLCTPDPELTRTILESYAEPATDEDDSWRLRDQEAPALRWQDISKISGLLQQIGTVLGYEIQQPQGKRWILWQNTHGELVYAFYPLASAAIGKLVSEPIYPAARSLLVFPGGRAGLVRFKLNRDPRLLAFVERGWRFVKFRHVRRLAEHDRLSAAMLDEQLSLDPLANQDPQIAFI